MILAHLVHSSQKMEDPSLSPVGEKNALPRCEGLNLFLSLFLAFGLAFNLEPEREIVEMQWVAERV